MVPWVEIGKDISEQIYINIIEILLWSLVSKLVNYWSHNQMILLRRFKMAIKHETSPKIFFFFLVEHLFIL